MLEVALPSLPNNGSGRRTGSPLAGGRRITDVRGLVWEVRDFWSDARHALLFTCTAARMRPELRATDIPLARLSDEELLVTLTPTDD